ncbi:MAG: GMC family oxidoreductase N-terminal domain-containing protein, partial [Gemmatimonadota bacterium]
MSDPEHARTHGPERGLVRLLRGLGLLLFVAAILYILAPVVGPWRAAFRPLPWLAASAAKVSLLGALCLYAAADLHRRRSLVRLIAFAHAFSVVAMLVLLLSGAATGTLPGTTLAVSTALWIAIALDGLILLLLWSLFTAAETPEPEPDIYALDDYEPVTAGEGNLRAFATVFGLLSVAAAGAGVWMTARGAWPVLLTGLPWVTNTATLAFTIGLVCFFATAEIRPRQALLGVVAHALGVATLVLLGYWALGLDAGESVRVSHVVAVPDLLLLTAAVFGASYTALFSLYQAAWRARYKLRYLEPMEFRTLLGLSDILIEGEDEALTALEVAKKVDATIFQIGAQRRWVYRLILFTVYLHPMLYFRAPLPEMARDARLAHLLRHFYHEPRRGALPKAVRDWISGFIRAAKQLAYVGYYSQREAWDLVGYVPFSERPPQPNEGSRDVSRTTLDVWGVDHPEVADTSRLKTDICIIGSGAAGAIISYELAKRAPDARILVVERGRYVPPAAFSEDEVEMMGALYADGLFQQTRDNRFTILQGSCVGGSTVVNNAVSFKPRPETLAVWKDEHGVDFGSELGASVDAVWAYMGIRRQDPGALNPSGTPYIAHATSGNVTDPLVEADIVDANIDGCLGSGYCNIGCAWGKKLSMLEKALPDGQATGDVSILSDARVEHL